MSKVLVTGMSGTGKSSVLRALGGRGHDIVDTDTDAWSQWATDEDGLPDWIWREDAMDALLAEPRDAHLFVSGCKSNQGAFYDRFDHIVVLTAPRDVLFERLAQRTDNPYGRSEKDRDRIVGHLRDVEPRLRASANAELDATQPVEDLADLLERLADGEAPAPPR